MTTKTITECPECGSGLGFADVAIIGEKMLVNGYESVAECPNCHVKWEWAKSGGLQVQQDERFPNKRGKPELVLCACGCKETFWTTHKDKFYKNNAHRTRGKRKGVVVDTRKRNVRSRERTKEG
jgi:hypothetical protein